MFIELNYKSINNQLQKLQDDHMINEINPTGISLLGDVNKKIVKLTLFW